KLEKNSTVIDSMLTDSTGAYSFVGLVSGTYTVKEEMQSGWTFTQPSSGSYTYLVTSGMDLVNVNFGNFKFGSITGLKFYDYDSSGAKGNGEVGLRNFNILLVDENDNVVDTAKTTTYGTYLFDSVFAGNYKVQEAAKNMFTRTYPDSYYAVTMTSGLDTSGLDFGNAYDGDTVKMRTFLVEDFNSNKGRFKGLRDTIFAKILDRGRLVVGVSRPDSNDFYGWLRSPLTRYHSASTRIWSFSTFIIRNYLKDRDKPVNKRRRDWKKYVPGPLSFTGEGSTVTYFGNFGNALSAEMTAAKTNIAASDSGIIPSGFGDLLYNNDSADVMNRADSLFRHWSVREILTFADSVLTMSRLLHLNGDTTFRWPQYYYELLYRTVSKIDSSFYKKSSLLLNELDTIHVQNPKYPTNPSKFLIVIKGVKGVKRLRDVKFLYRDPNKLPLLRQKRDYIVSLGEVPVEYSLEQNYQNPFNQATTIQFALPEPSVVTLKIYNILGQEITTLFNHDALDIGNHVVEFSGNDLPSGVYFYRLKVESVNELGQTSEVFGDVKKMLLVK
ncbi:MAG: T9SS type A sorting domain-containing protein, partial [Ignavibacteriales bacterium]|nr:T9SS type A sorting domain-containing protein [Ignavibacteriales bacterium]